MIAFVTIFGIISRIDNGHHEVMPPESAEIAPFLLYHEAVCEGDCSIYTFRVYNNELPQRMEFLYQTAMVGLEKYPRHPVLLRLDRKYGDVFISN